MGQNPGGQQTNGGQPAKQTQQSTTNQQQTPNQQGQQGQQTQQANRAQQRSTGERITSWFTETFVRTGVAVFGLVLLLFGLGQLAGVELLSIVGEFLTSSTGAWLMIAFFGVLLLIAASKSWNISQQ